MMTSPRSLPALVCLNLWLLAALLCLPTAGVPRARPQPVRAATGGLTLHWVRQVPALKPAWPDQPKLQFDLAAKPVVADNLVFVTSSRTDSVTALDAETGAERWRFFANGPVRFAPAVTPANEAATGRLVYVAADDGYLYCLDAASGRLLWKFRGGPNERQVLGNDRLISTWPARGAPVVADGVVYFAAGIWPFMGVFLHALDARTGTIIWSNSGDGSVFMDQPHYADSFAGIAPQGTIAVAGDRLLVANGRAVPAGYDRWTGQQLHFRLAENGHSGGGWDVQAAGKVYFNGGTLFDVETGARLETVGEAGLLTENALYCYTPPATGHDVERHSLRSFDSRFSSSSVGTSIPRVSVPVPRVEALATDGGRLYVGLANQVGTFDLPLREGKPAFSWQAAIDGNPVHLVAAGGRLFVSTRQGRLYCFGPTPRKPHLYRPDAAPVAPAEEVAARARQLIQACGVEEGFCVAWGAGTGPLVTALARQSSLRFVVIEADADKADALRQQFIGNGLWAGRAAVLHAEPKRVNLPPYLASLMLLEDEAAGLVRDPEFLRRLFASLRPYGGVACLPQGIGFDALVRSADALTNARVRAAGPWLLLARAGALPGSADWTHEHADAANTRVSQDQIVKAPLGLLWFGGPSHKGTLPRHGHGPQPQVVAGRLIIEGPDQLRGVDIYTGRLLWETRLPEVGKDFDNTYHQPGANASGTNYISRPDGIYVTYGPTCLRLDPATGQKLATFKLPTLPGLRAPVCSGYINIVDDYLVCGVAPAGERRERGNVAASKYLVVLNRHDGRPLWSLTAGESFRHNAICAGGGRLYAIDRPISSYSWGRGYGTGSAAPARLLALELKTGKPLWTASDGVFGTWLSYSARHDVVVEAGRMARDTLYDEPYGMRAYRAGRGSVLWHRPDYSGPAMIHGDIILKERGACELLTGSPVMRADPLTGQQVEWTWTRDYGCNTPAASRHLLTFRSGAAGFFDLENDGGTGNLGGFRSGCTNNLIVAGGLLNAPDYTRTCTCSYQNQTSLALVPMPEAELWTYFGTPRAVGESRNGFVRQVGINLGAPGNRRAPGGSLWLEYPVAGGPSYRLPITTVPEHPEWFRRHAALIEEGELKWVAASGAKGLTALIVDLAPAAANANDVVPARTYRVKLHFAEPDGLAAGQRVFDVFVQGQPVLTDFDVSKEAGGPNRAVVREFRGIKVGRDLTVTLTPSGSAPDSVPILCGVEIVAE